MPGNPVHVGRWAHQLGRPVAVGVDRFGREQAEGDLAESPSTDAKTGTLDAFGPATTNQERAHFAKGAAKCIAICKGGDGNITPILPRMGRQ